MIININCIGQTSTSDIGTCEAGRLGGLDAMVGHVSRALEVVNVEAIQRKA